MTYYVVKAYKDYHYPFLIENEDRRNDYGEAFDKSVVFKGTKEECENIVTPVNLKIVELEKELNYQKQARSIAENAVVDLTKENTDLKCECRRCVYSDCPCILSDYGKDRNGICDHFKDVFDENIELKDELKKWKNEWQEQVQKATDEGYARTLQTIQLTKAKDHIKKLLDCLKQDTNDPQTNYYVCQYMDKAEQFLNKNSTYERIQKAKYNYTD